MFDVVTKFDAGGGVMTVAAIPSQGPAFDDCLAKLGSGWKLSVHTPGVMMRAAVR